jgi:hypothetical protein
LAKNRLAVWLAKKLLIHRSSKRQAGKNDGILHASLEHLGLEYCNSEKGARFFRILGLWHFFRLRLTSSKHIISTSAGHVL